MLLLNGVVEIPKGPTRTALKPDRLIGVEELTLTSKRGQDAAMLTINAVL